MATSAIAAELQRKKNLGIAPTNQANVGAYNKLTAQSPTTSAVGSYLGANNTPTSPTPARTLTTGTGDWRSTLGQSKPPAVSTAFNSMHPTSTPTPSPTFTPYKPFEYTQANIEADPEYQAALATAKQNIQTSQNNTIAGLVANGQGNSSYSAGVAQQIANKEIGNVNNNILPQLIQQAYQRHQQDFANQNQLDQQNYGMTQDAFNNGITQGQLTGNYTSPEQQSVISQILKLKQQAEAPGITPDQRAGLSSQANVLRDRLTALGGNAAAVGADVSAANVNPYAGQRTLAGQQFDQGVKNDNLNAALQVGQQTGFNVSPQNDFGGLFRQGVTGVDSNGKPLTQNLAGQQWTEEQKQQIFENDLNIQKFEEDKKQNGLQYALQQNSQALASDDNLRQWVALDFDQQNAQLGKDGQGGSGYSGISTTQAIDSLSKIFKDANGKIPSDDTTKQAIFNQVINLGMPQSNEDQTLLSLGLTKADIDKFDAALPK